jgi:hypothetical protein
MREVRGLRVASGPDAPAPPPSHPPPHPQPPPMHTHRQPAAQPPHRPAPPRPAQAECTGRANAVIDPSNRPSDPAFWTERYMIYKHAYTIAKCVLWVCCACAVLVLRCVLRLCCACAALVLRLCCACAALVLRVCCACAARVLCAVCCACAALCSACAVAWRGAIATWPHGQVPLSPVAKLAANAEELNRPPAAQVGV